VQYGVHTTYMQHCTVRCVGSFEAYDPIIMPWRSELEGDRNLRAKIDSRCLRSWFHDDGYANNTDFPTPLSTPIVQRMSSRLWDPRPCPYHRGIAKSGIIVRTVRAILLRSLRSPLFAPWVSPSQTPCEGVRRDFYLLHLHLHLHPHLHFACG